jgi:hypothetical protein
MMQPQIKHPPTPPYPSASYDLQELQISSRVSTSADLVKAKPPFAHLDAALARLAVFCGRDGGWSAMSKLLW